MTDTPTLAGKTIIMSGGSRGIGLAIAKRAAQDGAQVAIIAKTDQPHPKLEGTVHTAADEIRRAGEAAGGRALAIVGDVRDEASVQDAVSATVAEFGGIDIVVNNASAINLGGSEQIDMKRFDLMHDINTRGTFLLTRTALPHLHKSEDPRILTLSPPVNLSPKWLGAFPGYMLAKYGMTLATLGIGLEAHVTATCLWPRTTIQTAAVLNILGGEETYRRSRTVEVYSDSAHLVLTAEPSAVAGQTLLCEDVLADAGITDLSRYSPGADESELHPDVFVD
ncbi:SDR family oxidoreductase [Gulosibacter faecalis]|jgi:citronellol/citronellal dehydrogenase|uniref:SDR family oxidoreductase n=1 Tax=Gulosibacter faecalis TaxID=272240 RepID=A0ABW5UYN3_9MICO|nr:NAD(P)-dependent oxidoreductase [Gulosibacter faecalis]